MVSERLRRELRKVLPEGMPELGELEAIYSADFTSPWDTLFGAIGFGIFAAGGVAGLLLLETEPDQKTAKNIVMIVIIALTGSVSLFALVMSILSWGRRFRRRQHWLFYTGGLGVLESGKAAAHRWSELTVWFEKSVFVLIRSGRKTYRLTGRKKRPISLPWFNKVKCMKLMREIQDRQADAVVPKLLKTVEAGAVTHFGDVAITKDAITVEEKTCNWDDVKRFDFAYDKNNSDIRMTVVCRDSPSLKGNLREIPNVWLMFSLVSALRPKIAKKTEGPEDYLK
jgi:Family of unknown function (DUF6585)